MPDIEIDGYYKKKAKEFTDILFDKNFLNKELTRKSIDKLEEFIGFTIQTECQMAARTAVLVARLKI